MRGSRAFLLISGAAAVAGFFYLSSQPAVSSVPFAAVIQKRADYRPPMEGVTLYPTEGPYGVGVIQAIAAGAGETLFVGTYGEGLFRSDDGGKHWTPANTGLSDKFIANLTHDEGVLYAATIRAGLFKSRDDGRHWASINRGLENADVESMISLPGGILYAGTGQGIFISRDEGEHWEPYNEGIGSVLVRSMVATKDQTVYAATQGQGIFKRRPSDRRWTQVVRAFEFEEVEERVVRTLTLGRGETLFAGTMGAGIFRSRDGGTRWERASAGLSNLSIRSLTVDGGGTLYAGTGEGIFYSDNDGARWTLLGDGLGDVQVHSFVTSQAGDLYAGTGDGLFRGRIRSPWGSLHEGLLVAPIRTLDYGKEGITVGSDGKGVFIGNGGTWMTDNVGLVNLSVRGMARGKTFLYIFNDDGLYRRQHGRHVWEGIEGVPPGRILSIAVDGTERVYLGTEEGLFHSSDHGGRWEKVQGIDPGKVSALAVEGEAILAVVEKTLWSKAGGEWKKVLAKEEGPFHFLAWSGEGHFLAANAQKVWEGETGGAWKEIGQNLPIGLKITAVAADAHGALYVGSERGLFWSGDGGAAWHPARLYQGERFEKRVNQILPQSDGAVWLATEENGVLLGVNKVPSRGRWVQWLKRRLS